ncbi:hypothetical protein M3J09_011915 [Ascochyta lentis]
MRLGTSSLTGVKSATCAAPARARIPRCFLDPQIALQMRLAFRLCLVDAVVLHQLKAT